MVVAMVVAFVLPVFPAVVRCCVGPVALMSYPGCCVAFSIPAYMYK